LPGLSSFRRGWQIGLSAAGQFSFGRHATPAKITVQSIGSDPQ
jgi:hypothetical protein